MPGPINAPQPGAGASSPPASNTTPTGRLGDLSIGTAGILENAGRLGGVALTLWVLSGQISDTNTRLAEMETRINARLDSLASRMGDIEKSTAVDRAIAEERARREDVPAAPTPRRP